VINFYHILSLSLVITYMLLIRSLVTAFMSVYTRLGEWTHGSLHWHHYDVQ